MKGAYGADMTPRVKPVTTDRHAGRHPDGTEPDSLEQLLGDCARMAPHWRPDGFDDASPRPAAELRGITVPAASAKLLDGMSEYGD
ncbi:hypothetical protein GCM10010361_77260 [Streptomyces olivaceiscleroticus]|uniref:Uncharacterized protein n=2 Tax=Streptomyces olivaceiscleroticus TaxID=68245 RepID=A0ABP3LLH3_9ACTN